MQFERDILFRKWRGENCRRNKNKQKIKFKDFVSEIYNALKVGNIKSLAGNELG